MTGTSEQSYRNCVTDMIAAAREIAQDDSELLTGDYAGFARVMWHDDDDMKSRGFDQDTYDSALREAWHRLQSL